MSTALWQTASIELVNPASMLLDRNTRTIVDLEHDEPELVASIRTHGVKIPVIAHRLDTGQLRVLDGHTRVLISISVIEKHPVVPVLVTDAQDEEEWAYLRDQWIANEVRRGYGAADKARIMEELTLFGLSVEAIAGQLSVPAETVEAGLAVQRSTIATQAVAAYPQLDILQLAALAEFDNDEDSSSALLDALESEPDQFDHVVSQLRHQRAKDALRDATAAELREAGVTVLDESDRSALPLRRLHRSNQDTTLLSDDPDAHTDCPGHAAVVSVYCGEPEITYVCQDWTSHGHQDAWSGVAEFSGPRQGPRSEIEKAEMKRARVNNERWRAAQDVRRDWLRTKLVAATKPPKQALRHLLVALAEAGPHLLQAIGRGSRYACDLLGTKKPQCNQPHPLAVRAKRATADQATLAIVAVVLGAFEEAYDAQHTVTTWRSPTDEDRLYFRLLKTWGYTLSPVEQLVLDPTADAADWPHLQADDETAAAA